MIDVEAITMISIFLFPLLSATILLLGYLNYRWLKIKIWKCFSQAFLLFLIATGITPMMYFTSNPTTIFIPFFGALPGLLGVVASAIYIISFLFIISFIKGAIKAVAPSAAAAAAAAAAAGGEISLLRDDILAVRGYGAMTNIVLASARPAIGDKPLRESLTEYFEYNPLLFEGCKIKDDGAINTEPLIKNLDRISGENRVQMVCSAFSALNSKIMNLYGAVTSPDLAEKALGVSYLTAKKQYSDLPVFFDILRSLPEGVLEEERLALLSREELGVRVKERTLELEKALEDVKKAKERVEELVKAEKERAGELKDARDVTLSVLEDTDEAKRELEKAKIDLEKAKGELEERVKERSAELEKAYKKLVKTEAAAAADKARAEEAEKYRKEIEKAYEELKSLDKMKSDFISIAAHELRTPLTPVKAYVELIKAGKMGKIEWRQMEKLIAADKNIDLLAKLIDDMLDITRIEAGKMDIRKEELSVAEVVDIALDRVKLRFGERKRRISIYTPEDLPLIYGDRELMIKVFDNLLSNAIKYTPATTSKIRIEAEKEGKNIHVSVADTGIGILKKDLEKVFERFYLVDSSLTRRHRGIGLGLAITKGIVEEHGGKIWAESKGLGNGSTFHVVLPVMGKEK